MKRNIFKTIVCLTLIAVMALAPLTAHASSKAYIMKVNAKDARLRVGPGNTEIITKLDKGEKVIYLGSDSKNYCKIYTLEGKAGYIYEEYLSFYGTVKKSMLHVTDGKTTLYKQSGDSLKKSSTLSDNQLVLVFKTNGSWAYIKTLSGKTGYCKTSSLQDAF